MDEDIIGAIIILVLLIVQQFLSQRTGNKNATRIEQESIKLSRQTSETVNRCSEKTEKVMLSNNALLDTIRKYIEKNDIGYLSTELSRTVQMLDKMDAHQDLHISTLDRINNIVRSIADDIQQTNSELAHENIRGRLKAIDALTTDIKRIVIDISKLSGNP